MAFSRAVRTTRRGTPRWGYAGGAAPGAPPPADVANVTDAVPKAEPRSATGNNPYTVYGTTYSPLADTSGYRERGIASWYEKKFHGKRHSSGEPYDRSEER